MTKDAELALADLAQDWVTLWQSEMTALTRDREAQEHWAKLVGLWAGMAGQAIAATASAATASAATASAALARSHDGHTPRPARTDDAARPTPTPATSDPGGQPGADQLTIAGLHQRVADLEARLAALDRSNDPRRD